MPQTTNFGWETPDVGGDEGTWGTLVNAALEAADGDLQAVSDVADAALPKAGGVLTGRLDAKTATIARQDLGAISGVNELDLAVAQYFTMEISGATALSFDNVPSGTFVVGVILEIVMGGSQITWPASVIWSSGTIPTLSSNGSKDVVVLLSSDSGTSWIGMVAALDVR